MSKSSRVINVHLPVQDELEINKFARNIVTSIFLEADFYNVLKLSHSIEIVDKILRKLNVIVTHDKFAIEYVDYDYDLNIDKLRQFNNSSKIIYDDELQVFLNEHNFKDSDYDKHYKIGYECSDEYMLIDMPRWTILIRNLLKT